VARALELLRAEIERGLGLLGCSGSNQLTPEHVKQWRH
jgi:hypothetical protein